VDEKNGKRIMTYEELTPLAAPANEANENEGWRDFPPDSSAGESGSEASLWLEKWAEEAISRGRRRNF
jgi:hypothetical protein